MSNFKKQTISILDRYPDILTVYQVKEILNIGLGLTYRLLKNGEIKSKRVGRDYKILKEWVIEYLTNYKSSIIDDK